jgi:hypothetical protein
VTAREAATLTRAADLLDQVHGLVTDALGDGHFDLDGLENLCGGGDVLRTIAKGEVYW